MVVDVAVDVTLDWAPERLSEVVLAMREAYTLGILFPE
jgi:hypothetical protein